MSRKHGGGRYRDWKSQEDRRRKAMFARMAQDRRRSRRTQAPTVLSGQAETIRRTLNIVDPRKRAESEAVRMPYNPGKDRFEPKVLPARQFKLKERLKLLWRSQSAARYRSTKARREKISKAIETQIRKRERGEIRKPPPASAELSPRALRKVIDERRALQKQINVGRILTASERREAREPRPSLMERLFGIKSKKETPPIPSTSTLFGYQQPTAEDTARRLNVALSMPVKIGERGLKGNVIESRYATERIVYPRVYGQATGAHYIRPSGVVPGSYLDAPGRYLVHSKNPETGAIRAGSGSKEAKAVRARLGDVKYFGPQKAALMPHEFAPWGPRAAEEERSRLAGQRRIVIKSRPLHDYPWEEYQKIIEHRRRTGAFVVDQEGRRVTPEMVRASQHRAFTDKPESHWETYWREQRQQRVGESDADYKERRKQLFHAMFKYPPELFPARFSPGTGEMWRRGDRPTAERITGVTARELFLYRTEPRSLDPGQRRRIKEQIDIYEDRRRGIQRQIRRDLKTLKAKHVATRKAGQKSEQLFLTMRREQAEINAAKLKAKRARREKWRKSLSKLTSRIFGR